jgi:hypothetical protein
VSAPENATACTLECPICHKPIRAWGAELLDLACVCPGCANVLIADKRFGGQTASCPDCGSRIRLPAKDLEPATLVGAAAPPAPPTGRSPMRKTIRLSQEEIDALTGIG